LGLRLSIEFVEMHGGHIWIESPDAKCNMTCFTIPKSIECRDVPVEMFSRDTY